MGKQKHYITNDLNEASYEGDLGFEELCKFYGKATPDEEREMDKILNQENWAAFRKLIQTVTGILLK